MLDLSWTNGLVYPREKIEQHFVFFDEKRSKIAETDFFLEQTPA